MATTSSSRKRWKDRVANATVTIKGKRGQGVLVNGEFILTATHCISWNGDGGMAMGDYFLETIETKSGASFRVGPVAADPISDIAVLGALDDQEFFKDNQAFSHWCDVTKGLRIATIRPHPGGSLPVHILTHKEKWISGRIKYLGLAPRAISHAFQCGCLFIEADQQVPGGTSGGPIVDSCGCLCGVVSHFSDVRRGEKCDGMTPIPSLALPHWIRQRIRREEKVIA